MPAARPRVARFARLALGCVERTYPNVVLHLLESDADARPPQQLHPAFHGCFDWHSAVHGHWTLARYLRLAPHTRTAAAARATLDRNLTPGKIAGELDYCTRRPGFERPYGLAWLLALDAELAALGARDPAASRWRTALAPLVDHAAATLTGWLGLLGRPIRTGEHAQTAFAMGLAIDWARAVDRAAEADLLTARSREFHAADRDLPLHLEPSAHDFLSPSLATADLMRRAFAPARFAAWLGRALPAIPERRSDRWLPSIASADRTDGKLVHLDGLALSRAWMLRAIGAALPAGDRRHPALAAAAAAHLTAGLAAFRGQRYAGTHWLGTFAMVAVTHSTGTPSQLPSSAR